MARYLAMLEAQLKMLDEWSMKSILRGENEKVDALVGVTTTLPIQDSIILLFYLKTTSSITLERVNDIDHMDLRWMEDIVNYLQTEEVPKEDRKQAHKLRVQVVRFTLINDQLFRQLFGGSYLRCLNATKAQYILGKLHEGICGHHPGG